MNKLLLLLISTCTLQIAFAQISSVNPNKGNRGQTLPIVISGANGNFTAQGSGTTIWLSQNSFVIGPGSSTTSQGSVINNMANVSVINSSTIQADVFISPGAPTGFYTVSAFSQNMQFNNNSGFEVLQGTYTGVSLAVGGGKPNNTVQETFTWLDTDLTGQTISSMWLSYNGQTILCTNPAIVSKNTNVAVDVNIPSNAENGFWNVNMITSTGDIYMSPGAFHVSNSFDLVEFEDVNIGVYPNPVHNLLRIDLTGVEKTGLNLRMIDIGGRSVLEQKNLQPGQINDLDVLPLANGVYFVQLYYNGRVLKSEKIIKQ